jgi:prevent-host-death family protein
MTKRFTATALKNHIGEVMDAMKAEGVVFITQHDRTTAALVSIEKYESLGGSDLSELDRLTAKFDAWLDRQQGPAAERAAAKAFAATPAQMRRASMAAARKRG